MKSDINPKETKLFSNEVIEQQDTLTNRIKKACDWISTNDLYYVANQPNPWVSFRLRSQRCCYDRSWKQLSKNELNIKARRELGQALDSLLYIDERSKTDSIECAIKLSRCYDDMTSTFSNDVMPYTFNRLAIERQQWVINSPEYQIASGIIPEPLRVLMKSVSGSKDDAFTHILQVLYWQQVSTSTSTLPALMLYGEEGSGKNLLCEFLAPTIYHGQDATGELNVEKIDGFNKMLEGKAMVLFNESDNGRANPASVKKILGSRCITIEPKGVDAYQVDNTALYVFTTNDPLGSLNLNQNAGSNRRFSVIQTTKSLIEIVISEGLATTKDEARDYIRDEIIPACGDRKAVAEMFKWVELNCKPERCPSAYHGDDYNELIGAQRSSIEETIIDWLRALVATGNGYVIPLKDAAQGIHEVIPKTHENQIKRLLKSGQANIEGIEWKRMKRGNVAKDPCLVFNDGKGDAGNAFTTHHKVSQTFRDVSDGIPLFVKTIKEFAADSKKAESEEIIY